MAPGPMLLIDLGHLSLGLCQALNFESSLYSCKRRALLAGDRHGTLSLGGLLLRGGGRAQPRFTQGLVHW